MTKAAENDFLSAVGQVIQMQVQLAVAPLLQKIDFLENELKKMNAGWLHDIEAVRGSISASSPIDAAAVKIFIDKEIDSRVECGLLADFDDVMVECGNRLNEKIPEIVAASVEAVRPMIPEVTNGKDGRDGVDCDMKTIVERVDSFLLGVHPADGRDGKDGKDGRDGVDGKSVSLDELMPVVANAVGVAVAALPDPHRVLSAHIDRDGCLHLVLNDGRQLSLGKIVGNDGAPGAPGKDGKDGADGLGFKDMQVTFDGERDLIFKFALDERVEEFSLTLPFQLYQGVWKAGQYRRGDTVTREGSQWVALKDTDAIPGTVDSGWQLSVKRGRDGKDGVGKDGPPGKNGEPGRDGQDLTQLGPDGKKWG